MLLRQPMETFSCRQGWGRSTLVVSLRERRSEIVDYQSADLNTDVRNSVAELFSATSDAAGMRGKGHVMIRMPPPTPLGRIRGRKMASVPTESFLCRHKSK